MFRALIERQLPSALYRGSVRHIRRGNKMHCLVGSKRLMSCCQRGRALSVMCLTLLSTSLRMDPPDQLRTALRIIYQNGKSRRRARTLNEARARERETHLLVFGISAGEPFGWSGPVRPAVRRAGAATATPRGRAPDMPRQGGAASGLVRLGYQKLHFCMHPLAVCGVARVLSLALTANTPPRLPRSQPVRRP